MARFKNKTDSGVTVGFAYGCKTVRLGPGQSYVAASDDEAKMLRRSGFYEVGGSSEPKVEKKEKD